MMLTLLFCLAAEPAECRKVEQRDVPLYACVMSYQFAAAEWLSRHPGYRLKAAICGPDKGQPA